MACLTCVLQVLSAGWWRLWIHTYEPLTELYVFCACSEQMLAKKAAGDALWFNPSRLTDGGRFANNSPALLARQAALGMFAAAWHCYTGGRTAECFRVRWADSHVPGVDGEPPVWALGLAGLLNAFQDTPGAGFQMVSD